MVTSVNGKYGTPGNNQVLSQGSRVLLHRVSFHLPLLEKASRSKVLEHLDQAKIMHVYGNNIKVTLIHLKTTSSHHRSASKGWGQH